MKDRFKDLIRIRWFRALVFVGESLATLHTLVETINANVEKIMTTQAEAAAALTAVQAELDANKARTEKIVLEIGGLQDKISELTAAAGAAGAVTPELQAAIDAVAASSAALTAQIGVADDQVPDAV